MKDHQMAVALTMCWCVQNSHPLSWSQSQALKFPPKSLILSLDKLLFSQVRVTGEETASRETTPTQCISSEINHRAFFLTAFASSLD